MVFTVSKEAIEAAKQVSESDIPEPWRALIEDTIESLTSVEYIAMVELAQGNGLDVEHLFLGSLKSRGFI